VKINILGVPFNGDGTPPAVENPAQGLRQAGLIHLLGSGADDATDLGDLPIPPAEGYRGQKTGVLNISAWREVSERLADRVAEILDEDAFPLILGGDCSILVGIFSAFVRREMRVGLVFLDGHGDFRAPEVSLSGEPADLELAVLTGRGPEEITCVAGKRPMLRDEDVIAYGIRERDQIDESRIPVYDRAQMAALGIERSVEEGVAGLMPKDLPLWLHFDVDALDPTWMPVVFPQPDGLTFEETREFLSLFLATGRVVGMSVTCYHPDLDVDGRAGKRLVALIANVLSMERPHALETQARPDVHAPA